MRQSDLAIEKYWVTQSFYFRISNTVALGMSIIDGKLLFCHGVTKENMDKKISSLKYNNRTVYDWFNNTFTADFGSPYLHLPTITIDDRPPPHKRSQYIQNLLPASISNAFENYVSTLITPSDLPDIIPTDVPTNLRVMNKYVPLKVRVNRGYFCRKHVQIRCYKKTSI